MTYNNYYLLKRMNIIGKEKNIIKTKEEKERLKSELEKAKRWVSSGNTKKSA